MSAREEIRNRKRIVIKIGSSSLSIKDTGGKLKKDRKACKDIG